jgi:hypothetical protein
MDREFLLEEVQPADYHHYVLKIQMIDCQFFLGQPSFSETYVFENRN